MRAKPSEAVRSNPIQPSPSHALILLPVGLLHVGLEKVGRIVAGNLRRGRHLDLLDGGEELGLANGRRRCAGDKGLGGRRRGGEEEESGEGLVADDHGTGAF